MTGMVLLATALTAADPADFNPTVQCNDNGTNDPTDDYYTVSIELDGAGRGTDFDLTGTYGSTTFQLNGLGYDVPHTLTAQIPIGTVLDLSATDNPSGDCYTIRIKSPGNCSQDFTCYAVADSGNPDQVFKYSSATGAWTRLGASGVSGIETVAFDPVNRVLYTADEDRFGTLDTLTGTFQPTGGSFTSMDGPNGPYTAVDVDGMSYDPLRGIIWASERRSGAGIPDYIFQIDPVTGDFVPDAFGPNVDYLVVEEIFDPVVGQDVYDVDDMTIDPSTGELYVISNQSGLGGVLTVLDITDGSIARVVGNFGGVDDMEALTFYNSGVFLGSTGNNGPDAADNNKFYEINKYTAALTELSPIDPTGTYNDFEACDCMTGAPNFITGTVYLDANVNAGRELTESGQAGVLVELYLDTDDDGVFTPGVDELIQSTTTDAGGAYGFTVAGAANFVVRIDPTTLPAGATMTTDNRETAALFGLNGTDSNNDFGFFQSCPNLPPPTSGGDATICDGDPLPDLTATAADPNHTVDWYDAAAGGSLLLAGSSTFSPPSAGTYYAETRSTVANCAGPARTAVTLRATVLTASTEPAICDNRGTRANSADDTFTIRVRLDATDAVGTQCQVVLNAQPDGTGGTILATGSFGQFLTVGSSVPFLADGSGTYPLTLREVNGTGCFTTLTVGPVANCSSCPPQTCGTVQITENLRN